MNYRVLQSDQYHLQSLANTLYGDAAYFHKTCINSPLKISDVLEVFECVLETISDLEEVIEKIKNYSEDDEE